MVRACNNTERLRESERENERHIVREREMRTEPGENMCIKH